MSESKPTTANDLITEGREQELRSNRSRALTCWSTVIQDAEWLCPDKTDAPEEYAAWLIQHGNDLVRAYRYRGDLLRSLNDFSGSRVDFDAAIRIGEELRGVVGAQYANDLILAYNSRGELRSRFSEFDDAITDYDAALAIGTALRDTNAERDWLVQYGNDLASVHRNRGILLWNWKGPADARADYEAAIKIRKALREAIEQQPGHNWLIEYGNDLARVLNGRGALMRSLGEFAGARADYAESIKIREALRQHFIEKQDHTTWLVQYGNNLANVYYNRGNLRRDSNDMAGATADFAAASEITEQLRQRQDIPQ